MSDPESGCLGICDETHNAWHTYTNTFFPKEERPTLLIKVLISELIKVIIEGGAKLRHHPQLWT